MPFLLTIISGLSTLIGFFLIHIKSKNIIKYSLALASGVMISVSIFDLIPESIKLLNTLNKNLIFLNLIVFITIGSLIPLIISKMINKNDELYKVGVLSMIAIIIHNIPEGIITFLSANNNINLGIRLSLAIMFHNIPEGITISVPIYYSSKSKIKAFKYTLISALSEPLGAVISYIFLSKIINSYILSVLLTLTAGIMMSISIGELFPKALKYKEKIKTIILFVIGLIIMIISINIMK